jgi:putative copper export protein
VSLRLLVLWVHVAGVAVWVGGVAYQVHVLLPAARRGEARAFVEAARRARPITWTAVALVVLSGFYNVTQLGSLERVMASGAGLLLAGKFGLVILAVALAAQRDFAHVPILAAAVRDGGDARVPLGAVARLDRVVLLLALVVIYLGLAVSRASA